MKTLVCDVHYEGGSAYSYGVILDTSKPDQSLGVSRVLPSPSEYMPGAFYKRELPCLLALVEEMSAQGFGAPDLIIIDGYVTLGANSLPGLGQRLYDQLDGKVPVIGIAKGWYLDTLEDCEVYRGKDSTSPLYVTSAGMPLGVAKDIVRVMPGRYRLPEAVKAADKNARALFKGPKSPDTGSFLLSL